MNPALARLIADNEQNRAHAEAWWREATQDHKIAIIQAVLRSHDDPLAELVARFAQLAVGEMLEQEFRSQEKAK